MELAFYASRNAERERGFLFTQPLHWVHGGAWYSRQRFPQPPPVQRLADLGSYRLCGLLNSNYAWLRDEGVTRIDLGAPNLQVALRNLHLDRCELVLATFEQVRGSEQSGQLEPDEQRAFLPYPGRGPVSQHLLVSRRSPRAQQLLEQLDQALDALQRDGSRDALYQRYLGPALKPDSASPPR
jgi:polar amino acid transport system substrate-binding protein